MGKAGEMNVEEFLAEWLARLRLGRAWLDKARREEATGKMTDLGPAAGASLGAGPSEQDMRLLLLGRADRPRQTAALANQPVGWLNRGNYRRPAMAEGTTDLPENKVERTNIAGDVQKKINNAAKTRRTEKLPDLLNSAPAVTSEKIVSEENVAEKNVPKEIVAEKDFVKKDFVKKDFLEKEFLQKKFLNEEVFEKQVLPKGVAPEKKYLAGQPEDWPEFAPLLTTRTTRSTRPDEAGQIEQIERIEQIEQMEQMALSTEPEFRVRDDGIVQDMPVMEQMLAQKGQNNLFAETEDFADLDRLAEQVAERLREDIEAVLGSSSLV